jgi:regulator of sigma E protease
MKSGEVRIAARGAKGEALFHLLDLSSLEVSDLEGEFLDKLGLHLARPAIPPVIGKMAENSVAARSGMREGDVILRANGIVIQHWMALVEEIRKHPGQTVLLDIRRGKIDLNLSVIPDTVIESGVSIGRIGVSPKLDPEAMQAVFTEVKYSPVEALEKSMRKTWETSVISLKMMGKMVMGEISMKNLSGPITIADYAGQSAEMGLVSYLSFLALISISLGVLNLLPIPLLDGGHLLYYTVELFKGSPVSELAWEIGQKIGIALLGTLMLFAIYNDINRLISG